MPDTHPSAAPVIAMTPGRYMRLRREAAGLSIDDVAKMLGRRPAGVASYRNRIQSLEANDPHARHDLDLIDVMAGVFSFDPSIFHVLVDRAADPTSELPLPAICRVCACTWRDPCDDPDRGPCSWAEPDLCSHCVGKEPANDRGETGHAA